MDTGGRERRGHPRRTISCSVIVGDEACRVRDLSRSGVAFTSVGAMAEMSQVRLSMDLPGSNRHVEGLGTVVRCEPDVDGGWGIAVFFTELDEEDREAIDLIVHAD